MTTHRITGHGGVTLTVHDLGPQDAPPILLVHGYSQASQSFARQHLLSDRFRLIIPDLRGHGQSDKPTSAEDYASEAWAGDIAAIVENLSLDSPALIGWSMGGWVVGDYIRHHGDAALACFGLIGSSVTTGEHLPAGDLAKRGADPDVAAKGMLSGDLSENLSATVRFVRACFYQQPNADDLAVITGFNMLCPPVIRGLCRTRSEDFRPDYARATKPALILRGAHERLSLPDMHQQAVAALPRATALEYENSGHSPFWEEADRFNADLASFVKEARQ